MISAIKYWFYRRQLNLRRKNLQTKSAPDYNPAKTILIIYNRTNEANWKDVGPFISQLKKDGKKVDVVGYLNKKEISPSSDVDHPIITRKEVTWYNGVKVSKIEDQLKDAYDVVINLDMKGSQPSQFLTAYINAPFKAGVGTANARGLHLTIDATEATTLKTAIRDLRNTLNVLSKD